MKPDAIHFDNTRERTPSEITDAMAVALNKKVDLLSDKTVNIAIKAKEAREFLDYHVDHVRGSWMDWLDESEKVLESIRQARVAIGFESNKLLSDCGEVRKFFISDQHEIEVKKLREFIELAERLRSLKDDGTLDKIADVILKLS